MFRIHCHADALLDPKGRIALPKPIRKALAEQGIDTLVLMFHKGAIQAWPPREFADKIERRIEDADPLADDVLDFQHAYLALTEDVVIDKQGRILIPLALRNRAGLSRDVIVNGMVGHVDLWDRKAWEKRYEEANERQANRSGMPRAG